LGVFCEVRVVSELRRGVIFEARRVLERRGSVGARKRAEGAAEEEAGIAIEPVWPPEK
jgi:hypothetical protein